MVDFQSRDTRSAVGDDEADADDEPSTDEEETPDSPDGDTDSQATERAATEASEKGFAVVSVGTGRTVETDAPGEAVIEEIDGAGGGVVTREVIDGSYDTVQSDIESLISRQDVLAVVTTGGTGVEPDDVTIEAVEPMLDRTLDGFGELLRLLCYEREGSAVIRTRATAGTIDGVPVFCLPGDPDFSREAVRELVVPEAETLGELAGPAPK